MCCLFGIVDYKHKLTYRQKDIILKTLSVACEVRGKDATGIAYNRNGKLEIHKKPLPAHKFKYKIPNGTDVIMGHTRLTTQGSEKLNWNNHPFEGRCINTNFALAHNGIISNDIMLRKKFNIPKTNIETDSFVAVQIIEKEGTFNINAIRKMAESVEGSFCFTLLDSSNCLYIVKGDNPIAVFNFESMGFYIYASTEEILKNVLKTLSLTKSLNKIGRYKKIDIKMGDILVIHQNGETEMDSFDISSLLMFEYPYCAYYNWGFSTKLSSDKIRKKHIKNENMCISYLEELINYAGNIGISEDEIMFMYENGFDEEEIENMLYDPYMFRCCLEDTLDMWYV